MVECIKAECLGPSPHEAPGGDLAPPTGTIRALEDLTWGQVRRL